MYKWIFALFVVIILTACSTSTPPPEETIDLPRVCEGLGGKWLNDYNECEGMTQGQCAEFDGTFNECASACRHNTERVACTMQCVQVCLFE